jgi:uncharacterized protein (TIGR03437 family)
LLKIAAILLVLTGLPAAAQTVSFKTSTFTALCQQRILNRLVTSFVTGDFNGDGKPDVAYSCVDRIVTLLGKGDGAFQAPASTIIPTDVQLRVINSGYLLAAKLTNGRSTDLIYSFSENRVGYQFVRFVSNADGTFQVNPIPVDSLSPLAVADFNNDRLSDLLVQTFVGRSLSLGVVLGQGGGTFSALMLAPVDTFEAQYLVVGDFNSDGKADIIYRQGVGASYFLQGKGDGTFAPPGKPIALALPQAIGDFNGDGKLDLVASDSILASGTFVNFAVVALGNGDGVFADPVKSSSQGGTLVPADLNGDGKTDLVNPIASGLFMLVSKGDGSFQSSGLLSVNLGSDPLGPIIADLNGDGKPDLVVVNPNTGEITVAINTTAPSVQVSAALNAASFATTQGIASGSLISLFGAGLGTSAGAQASVIPLPNSLGGTSVTINGTPAPLTYVSATQINAQVPWTVSTGTASVIVTNNGQALPAFTATVIPSSPGIFSTQSGTGQAIAINPDGSLAGPSGSIPGIAVRPATPGDPLIILATGLGAVDSTIADGAASSDKLRNTVTMPQVLIDGISAAVAFSGLSPQFVGVNQINVTVPSATKTGVVSLQLRMSAITTTDKVTIAVQNP